MLGTIECLERVAMCFKGKLLCSPVWRKGSPGTDFVRCRDGRGEMSAVRDAPLEPHSTAYPRLVVDEVSNMIFTMTY
jgi:hypothetical protein